MVSRSCCHQLLSTKSYTHLPVFGVKMFRLSFGQWRPASAGHGNDPAFCNWPAFTRQAEAFSSEDRHVRLGQSTCMFYPRHWRFVLCQGLLWSSSTQYQTSGLPKSIPVCKTLSTSLQPSNFRARSSSAIMVDITLVETEKSEVIKMGPITSKDNGYLWILEDIPTSQFGHPFQDTLHHQSCTFLTPRNVIN